MPQSGGLSPASHDNAKVPDAADPTGIPLALGNETIRHAAAEQRDPGAASNETILRARTRSDHRLPGT